MILDVVRLFERVHGHLGWLAVAALVHPAILLRDPRRRADLSVTLSVALVTVAAAVGVGLYGSYTGTLKQQIFLHAPAVGLLFERKEHLAFGAVLLAWTGAVAYTVDVRRPRAAGAPDALRTALRRLAFHAYVGAAALAAVVATLGTIVAVYKSF